MIGRRLSHYVILDPLAAGGMGVVYRARDEHLERDVAIKVLPEGMLADDTARRRLRREALALSGLSHPNILSIHDYDRQDGLDFIVMELVPGESLASRIDRGALPVAEVLRLGSQIASALAAAHGQGVVHRDLKPGNVMLTRGGDAKVLDFGLAKRLPVADVIAGTTTITEPQAMLGTLPYMAPEQVLGRPLDARTDLFALGIVLFEMTSGRRPFQAQNPIELAAQILNQDPPELPELRPEVPPPLSSLVARCLARNPMDRPASADEVMATLRAIVPDARRGITASKAASSNRPPSRRPRLPGRPGRAGLRRPPWSRLRA